MAENKPVRKSKTGRKKGLKKTEKDNLPVEKSTIFSLEGINPAEILLLHYNSPFSDSEDEFQDTLVQIEDEEGVGINDILHEKSKKSKRSIMFLDPHKGHVKLWGIMFDVTINGALPLHTTKPCWYCRNKFYSHPIGCPIRYNPNKKEGIIKKAIENRFNQLNLTIEEGNDFFETEGLFCSFPCVKSYILEELSKSQSPKYKKAQTLLSLLYKKLFGVVVVIPKAGSWKLTEDWGGHLTPQELRASTGMLEYIETINVKRPYMFCSSSLIREKRL